MKPECPQLAKKCFMFYLFLQVVNDGIILSFVSYPSAMSYMDAPPLWSFLFFFMLVNLAISSSCGGIQTIATFFMDEWPSLRKKRMLVFICISVFLYLCGKKIMKIVNISHSCTQVLLYFTHDTFQAFRCVAKAEYYYLHCTISGVHQASYLFYGSKQSLSHGFMEFKDLLTISKKWV